MAEKKKLTPIQAKMIKIGEKFKEKGLFPSDAEIETWKKEREELAGKRMIKDSVDQAKKHIGKPPPHEQMLLSFMPTTMTRTTPFFPMSKKDMKDRPYDELTWETPWGRITVSGKRLAVHDEGILLLMLALVRKHKSDTFLTTQYQLCKLANIKPATNTYSAIWNSIDRLAGTKINIEIFKGKGRNRKLVQEMTGAIVSWAGRDHTTGKLKIVLNPYFNEMFGEGFLTNIDLRFRSQLKGDISKALYRFLQGQKPFYEEGKYEIQLLKLCVAINVQVEGVETHRLRSLIRTGLKELRNQNYLSRWRLNKQDYVIVWKSTPKKKLLNN
ncbi:hypothetical protein ES702_07304 [subsurface metagenome]